jgi:hypothetical protein
MLICPICRTSLNNNDLFCRACGYGLRQALVAYPDFASVPDRFRWRMRPMEGYCTRCGRIFSNEGLFCDRCGAQRRGAYGFPIPVVGQIRHWWIRWDRVPEKPNVNAADVLLHDVTNPFLLRKQYLSQGWNTTVILQDATHDGPTTAMAIGYPKEWPNALGELSKWGENVILRLHVDICMFQHKLVSQPHVEPDPEYNTKEHLDMWRKKDEIRGSLAVQILQEFFKR